MYTELIAGPDDNGRRIDRILRKALSDYPLSMIHRLLRQKKIKVNGKHVCKPEERIYQGDTLQIFSVTVDNPEKKQGNNSPIQLPEIIWQGSGIIIFNKPSGISTHGPNSLDTLVKKSFTGESHSISFKPGPLHRLDKPTSGIIAFSQTLEGAILFSHLLHEKLITKKYLAIIEGEIKQKAIWQDDLVHNKSDKKTYIKTDLIETTDNAKEAFSVVKPYAWNGNYSLVEIQIKTGRTHQIRAQASHHGHPLAGDLKYGSRIKGDFFLHAWQMEFIEEYGKFPKIITAPLPDRFISQINSLFGKEIAGKITRL